MYSASSIDRRFFVYSDKLAAWDMEEIYSYVQPSYNNNDALFETAFTRFIYNYLEA